MSQFKSLQPRASYHHNEFFMVEQLLGMAQHYQPKCQDHHWLSLVRYVLKHIPEVQRPLLLADLEKLGAAVPIVAPQTSSTGYDDATTPCAVTPPCYVSVGAMTAQSTEAPTNMTVVLPPAPEPWTIEYRPRTGRQAPGAPRKTYRGTRSRRIAMLMQ